MNTWNLRTEILNLTHRWYWVVASFLLGAFLGWLVSIVIPSPYRAVLDIYVGINAYRAPLDTYISEYAQEEFRNLDDYKNWQMGQLSSLALGDEFLSETLKELQAEDSEWQNYDVPALRAMLAIGWRNTGDWHFSAKAEHPELAEQAVQVWTRVVTGEVETAVYAARQLVFLDSDLNAISQALVTAQTRQRTLNRSQDIIQEWKTDLANRPTNQPLPILDYWNLIAQVTAALDWNAGWADLLAATPEPEALPDVHIEWLNTINALVNAELNILPDEIADFKEQSATLASEYTEAADRSRALSANLEVKKIVDQAPQTIQERHTATLMFVSGILGVCMFLIFWLVQISRQSGG